MRKFIPLIAIVAAIAPGIAAAAEPPCLTPAEFTSLAGYSMPSILKGTSQRCAATLGPDAYLRRSGGELVQRYAVRKAQDWVGAKSAFLKLSAATSPDANKLFRDMPDPSLQPIVDGLVEGMVSQQIPLDRCQPIDRLIRLLSPLPPENTAELIGLAVGLGSKTGSGKLGKIAVCPA